MKRAVAAATLALAACGKLQNVGGGEPPLVSFNVTFSGDIAPLRPTGDVAEQSLQVALVWGNQWLTEPLCILTPESDAVAAVVAAGCRDSLGFVPKRVGPTIPVAMGQPSSLSLLTLPTADLLVGDVTARMAYGSFVLYDDRNNNGILDLSQPHPTAIGREGRGGGDDNQDVPDSADIVYGASFVSMMKQDRRAAYREGNFDETSAFYPRSGCATPPPRGFSVVGAGGFTEAAAMAAGAMGQLPAEEDPTQCFEAAPSDTVVNIAAAPPADVAEVACDENTVDGSTRYDEPPAAAPDVSGRVTACAHLPSFDAGTQSKLIQFVVSGRATDKCKGLTHYTLRGCRETVFCPVPDWDLTMNPPSWWPCPL